MQWGLMFWRYYRMMKRIKKNPEAKSYSDEAMRLPSASDETDKIVELFADKIPHTHGAPVRKKLAAPTRPARPISRQLSSVGRTC
jgi:hypothetical protein